MAHIHEKFVLKEKQRLQLREKDLEKREAETATVREENAQLVREVQAKSSQLAEAAKLLRRSSEERDAARCEAEKAAAALQQAVAAAKAEAQAKAHAAVQARADKAEAQASTQEQRAMVAGKEASQARASLHQTIEQLQHSEEQLREKERAVHELQQLAAMDKLALSRALGELQLLKEQLKDAKMGADGLKKVLSLAFARHIRLLQALKERQSLAHEQATALEQMRALRVRDEEQLTLLGEQVRCLEHEHQLKQQLEQQVFQMAKDNEDKASALARLESAIAAHEETLTDVRAKLRQTHEELSTAQERCTSLQVQLDGVLAELKRRDLQVGEMEQRLAERMHWIESLETSTNMWRQRVGELWAQLQAFLGANRLEHQAEDVSTSLVKAALESAQARLTQLESEREELLCELQKSAAVQVTSASPCGAAALNEGDARGTSASPCCDIDMRGDKMGCDATSRDDLKQELAKVLQQLTLREAQVSKLQQKLDILNDDLAARMQPCSPAPSPATGPVDVPTTTPMPLSTPTPAPAPAHACDIPRSPAPAGVIAPAPASIAYGDPDTATAASCTVAGKQPGKPKAVSALRHEVVALRSQLQEKSDQLIEMEQQVRMLREMVRAHQADTRAKAVQNTQLIHALSRERRSRTGVSTGASTRKPPNTARPDIAG
eukprot:CAMPEP_0119319006 /NCGR_PEP_ID=MMETSP1333-20130426/48247_1 /TAXON_ID=418940 /ORGANISM="Scyphosphaera apsteinii, Strain RCC1455" /LENGTH=665 /DNA_ID=CAMNT_0007325325 /DNA_START=234 /DNA_END=2231 /DNA_ORIENTATION=+